MPPTSVRKQIIDFIQEVRTRNTGASSTTFAALLEDACPPHWRKSDGKPIAEWGKTVETYIRDLQRCEAWTKFD